MKIKLVCDLRNRFGDARDQLTRPTCLAFAISDAHGATFPAFQTLSVEFLYYHAVQKMPGRDPHAGVNLVNTHEALNNDGQPDEAHWPYQAAIPSDTANWKPPLGHPVFKRSLSIGNKPFADICTSLDSQKPVIICFEMSECFYRPQPNGVVEQKTSDPFAGSHAVIALGHGYTAKDKCLLIRNSWGSEWGQQGHAFLEEGYLRHRLVATAVVQ